MCDVPLCVLPGAQHYGGEMYQKITIEELKQLQERRKVWTIRRVDFAPKQEILEMYNHDELLFVSQPTGPTGLLFWFRILIGIIQTECKLRVPEIIVGCGIDSIDYLLKAAAKHGIKVMRLSGTNEEITSYLESLETIPRRVQYCEIFEENKGHNSTEAK